MAGPKHLILISVDALRFDALSCERDRRHLANLGLDQISRTPRLDRFASEGVRFSNCRVTAPNTPASHASIFTGQYPYRHGLRLYLTNTIRPESETVFERFGKSGFSCLANVDFLDTFRISNLCRGAEHTWGDRVTIEKFKKLDEEGKRVALFCHVGDVHHPYGINKSEFDAPENEAWIRMYLQIARELNETFRPSKRDIKNIQANLSGFSQFYSQQIQRTALLRDQAAGILFPLYLHSANHFDAGRFTRFFDQLESQGLLKDTLVVITADHGESLYDTEVLPGEKVASPEAQAHQFGHGHGVSEGIQRVPLIFWSGSKGLIPSTSEIPVSSVDILPTVLDLFEIPFERDELNGISRADLLHGRSSAKSAEPSPCYSEAWTYSEEFNNRFMRLLYFLEGQELEGTVPEIDVAVKLRHQTIREGQFKYVTDRFGEPALYDTEKDPGESANLLGYEPYLRADPSQAPALKIFPDYLEIAERLRARLNQLVGESGENYCRMSGLQPSANLENLEESLRNLGYMED